MLSSRSSTPRPRQVGINETSLMDYSKDPPTSSDASWTTMTGQPLLNIITPSPPTWTHSLIDVPDEVNQETACADQTIADTRPRKRRRITSGGSIAAQRTPPRTAHPNDIVTRIFVNMPVVPSNSWSLAWKLVHKRHAGPVASLYQIITVRATPSPRPSSKRLLADDSSDSFEGIDADDLRMRLSRSGNLPTASKRRSSSSAISSSGRDADNETNDTSWWEEPSSGGCGRVICQACAVEDADR
ncbi:hypothetical protein RHS01_02952 [Rhizoctonia solani]|uniref:Uncharacterized protein n=1 Tax=Rhizoctonia solani TaxID=456999 RepID=A0A8H7IM24_9AGAM|nr:hypothetical protein RHS01_02952 [Rhizoctonia solani]